MRFGVMGLGRLHSTKTALSTLALYKTKSSPVALIQMRPESSFSARIVPGVSGDLIISN